MSLRRARQRGWARTYGLILIASLTVGSVATAASVWWYYTRQLGTMKEAVVREIRAIGDERIRQISDWRRERLGDGHVLMASPVEQMAERILTGRGSDSDRAGWRNMMEHLESAFLYRGATLSDLEGRAALTVDSTSSDVVRLRSLTRDAVAARGAQLADLWLDSRGRPLMALTVPVGERGAIVLDIDPARFLYPFLSSWPGTERTGETILTRRDGDDVVCLSELRFRPDAPLVIRRSIAGLPVPSDTALAAGSFTSFPDYRGVPVISMVRRVPDSPWYLTTKVDAAEALAQEQRLGWEMAIITGLIALVTATGAALVWMSQRAQVLREREAWFNSIANETPACLWMTSAEEANVFINTAMAKFLGTEQNSLNDDWEVYIHPDDRDEVRNALVDAGQKGTEFRQEFRIRRYDGEYRWAVSTGLPRLSPKGVFLGFTGSLLDIHGRRLAEQRLREANASIAQELAESTRKEHEIQELSARLIDAHEEERKRLARELHDDLSQQIAALSIATGNLKRHVPTELAEVRAQSDRIHGKLVQLAGDVRRMSHELHPAILQYSGLAAALRAYCEEFGTLTGIEVSLAMEGALDEIAPATALCLFRVTQEAMRNVAKHAQVNTASVELKRTDGFLELTISDKGVGMDAARAASAAGLGLLNIRERVRLVRGKLAIRSAPGQGTTITVQVPE